MFLPSQYALHSLRFSTESLKYLGSTLHLPRLFYPTSLIMSYFLGPIYAGLCPSDVIHPWVHMTSYIPFCLTCLIKLLTFYLTSITLFGISDNFSSSWRVAVILPLPKPGKDHQLTINYRPISLT